MTEGIVEKRTAILVVLPCDEEKAMRSLDLYPLLPHYLFVKPGATTSLLSFYSFRKVYVWSSDDDFDRAMDDMAKDVRVFYHAGGV